MGTNSTHAAGIAIFLLAFVLLAAGIAAGGNLVLIIVALALLALSAGVFLKAKLLEEREG